MPSVGTRRLLNVAIGRLQTTSGQEMLTRTGKDLSETQSLVLTSLVLLVCNHSFRCFFPPLESSFPPSGSYFCAPLSHWSQHSPNEAPVSSLGDSGSLCCSSNLPVTSFAHSYLHSLDCSAQSACPHRVPQHLCLQPEDGSGL